MNRDAFSSNRNRAIPVEQTKTRVNHSVPTIIGLSPLSRPPVGDEERHRRVPAQDKAFQRRRGSVLTAVVCLFLFILVTAGLSIAATAKYPEEIWKELEKLSQPDREKKLTLPLCFITFFCRNKVNNSLPRKGASWLTRRLNLSILA